MKKLSLLIMGTFLGLILAFTIPNASAHNEDLLLLKIKQLEGKISKLETDKANISALALKADALAITELRTTLNMKADISALKLKVNSSELINLRTELNEKILQNLKIRSHNIFLIRNINMDDPPNKYSLQRDTAGTRKRTGSHSIKKDQLSLKKSQIFGVIWSCPKGLPSYWTNVSVRNTFDTITLDLEASLDGGNINDQIEIYLHIVYWEN